jgi:GDPmannose 4,6-dehydratase
VALDPRYQRAAEVDFLRADGSKARRQLGWEAKVTFRNLVRIMVDADLQEVGLHPGGEGFHILAENFGRWHQWDNAVSRAIAASSRVSD